MESPKNKAKRFVPTAKNTVISPDFLVWKFFGKAQFPHSLAKVRLSYTDLTCYIQTL